MRIPKQLQKRLAVLSVASVVSVTLLGIPQAYGGTHIPRSTEAATTDPQPPPGFDPLTATASTLQEYGFPPRPTDAEALAAWTTAMQHAIDYLPPLSVPSSVLHKLPSKSSSKPQDAEPPTGHSVLYSNNWAGHIMPNGDEGNADFKSSLATWTQPSVPGNSGYTNYQNAPDASFWDGIGTTDLIQAGADSISTSTASYHFWIEDYPLGTTWETNPPLSAGDIVYVSVTYNGNDTTSFYLANESTNKYTTVPNFSTPYVGYTAADFINERIGSYYLPNYGSTRFSYCGTITYPLQAANNNIVYMTSTGGNGGTLQSSPSSVTNSDSAFTVTWEHS
jgi:hypothetical protein